jgi:hypothetical protein
VAIDTRDKLIAALATAQRISFFKASQTAEGAGLWHSLLKAAGYPAPATASPPAYTVGSGYIPVNSLLGSLNHLNASGGNGNYVLGWNAAGSTLGRLILYDRVWHCSGFTTNGSNPTTLSVTTPGNINRPSNWLGLEIFLEVYVAPGATGSVWTINYVDAADANQVATYAHPANAESVGQMMPMNMTVNTGVKSITSFTQTIASAAAGDIGCTVLCRICEFPITIINVGDTLDAYFLGLAPVVASACLNLMVLCSTTNTGVNSGQIIIGQG